MEHPDLNSDCANCAALCCIALAFDKSNLFGIDKAAGVACPNLAGDHTCSIHADLARSGFQGCINYQCDGAGQRVTQKVFKGRSWRENPDLLAPTLLAFAGMRDVHSRLALLASAEKLRLSTGQREQLVGLQRDMADASDWSVDDLSTFAQSPTARKVQSFLTSLASLVSRPD